MIIIRINWFFYLYLWTDNINDQNKYNSDEFNFYVKEIEIPNDWEKDFLHKQMAKPWIKVGTCKIVKDSATFYWNDKMQVILKNEK